MAYVQQIIPNVAQPITRGDVTLVAGSIVEDNIPGHSAAASVVFSKTVLGGASGEVVAVVSAGTLAGTRKITFTSANGADVGELSYVLLG